MRIGIFGGTFNPIHYGHLINAEIVKEDFSLDKIIFIPVKCPVHKKLIGSITSNDRLKMLEIAIQGNSGFDISTAEIDRDSESYTITTLHELSEIYPEDKLYLIIGSDSFLEIDTWKEPVEILKIASLIIIKRPGDNISDVDKYKMAKEILIANNPNIELSSSNIRDRIKNGKSVRYMIPERIQEYIRNRGLYKN